MMTRPRLLERTLFVAFVVTIDSFVAINLGWAFLSTGWGSIFFGIIPALGITALGCFLAFVVLEDRLRRMG